MSQCQSLKWLSGHASLKQMDKLLFGKAPGITQVAYIFRDGFTKLPQALPLEINKWNFQEGLAGGVILFSWEKMTPPGQYYFNVYS